MKIIRSRDNPQFKQLARLAGSGRESRKQGLALLDGEHLITAFADAAAGEAELLAVAESAAPAARSLFESTPARQKLVLADALLKAVSPVATPTGLVAVVPVHAPQKFSGVQSCLLLEGLQDPGNLGTILRTAAAAGLRHIFLSPASVHAWSPKVLRAAMGAHFSLAIHEDADLPVVAGAFRGPVLATLPDGTQSLYETDLRPPVAWIFGSEGAGVSEALAAGASVSVSVPMPGGTESLNVASCVAICLFEQVRQRTMMVEHSRVGSYKSQGRP